MATIAFVKDNPQGKSHRHTWTELGQGDDGAPISMPGASDQTVQVIVDTLGGATLIIEGSLEATPTTYFNLTDHNGNAIQFSASGGELVAETTMWIRPRVSGGDATTDIDVILFSLLL